MEHLRLLEQPNAVLGKCSREGEKRSRSEQEKAEFLKVGLNDIHVFEKKISKVRPPVNQILGYSLLGT